jgi:2-methylisocitrate lyase-like PEP mutase family enzyme
MTSTSPATRLHQLHDPSRILVLANVWDVATARLVEKAGFHAVATSSAAVAWALGYADGERIQRDEMLDVVRRIARAVRVPVTADVEAGYGPSPDDAVQTAQAVVAAGAVGMNFEDSISSQPGTLLDVSLQVERIQAIKQAVGDDIVLNARTDVFLDSIGPPHERLDHAVRRANAYREAGADCLFVPGVRDPHTIRKLVEQVNGPLNILTGPGAPSIPELAKLGVARVSFGSGLARVMLTRLGDDLTEIMSQGTCAGLNPSTLSHAEVNKFFLDTEN